MLLAALLLAAACTESASDDAHGRLPNDRPPGESRLSIRRDDPHLRRGERIEFRVEIVGFRSGAAYDVVVVKNGAPFLQQRQTDAALTFADTPAAGERAYYRVEVRGETPEAPAEYQGVDAGWIGLTNPVYVGYD